MDTEQKLRRIAQIKEEIDRLDAQLIIPEMYADMLRWTNSNGIIKAYPKRPLSITAHKLFEKAFKKAGGAYVSNNGDHYYELVTKPRVMSDTVVSRAYHELQENGVFEEAT